MNYLVAIWCGVFHVFAGQISALPPTTQLGILTAPYPRAFFFRMSEGMAASPACSYERWEGAMSRLMGIEGKVLDEELVGRSVRNVDFFTRFKKEHPDQIVLLHYNGNARLPSYQAEKFFAGHWLYYNGSKVLADVSADEHESIIKVENPRLFRTQMGRFQNSNEDVGICLLDRNGRPDWSKSEQLELISIDEAGGTIRVRRGCFGTSKRSFPADRSYVAAHACEGPWGTGGHLSWQYNHATTCPKDAYGKMCVDLLADELAGQFGPGGILEVFDGLELDSSLYTCLPQKHRLPGRSEDCNADGKADGGVIGGVNVYGIGVVEFCRKLRSKLQTRQLLLADGGFLFSQRAAGVINGIESEGWPEMRDYQIRDWSSGLNRMLFWKGNARPPVFNYINHKFSTSDNPGVAKLEIPFSSHRLVMAVAQCADAGLCYINAPHADQDGNPGIWDELINGQDKQLGWLGNPLGETVRLALKTPDLLTGKGKSMEQSFVSKLDGPNARWERNGKELKISSNPDNSDLLLFSIQNVPAHGGDLFIQFTMRGEGMKGYPREIPRMTWVALNENKKESRQSNPKIKKQIPRKFMTWTNEKRFTSGLYFTNVRGDSVDLAFEIDGTEPVWISELSVHSCPDVIYREFEQGLVLANPAPHSFSINMRELFGDKGFRRILGTAKQDPQTNNGAAVGDTIALGAKDGLFLRRTDGAPQR